MHGKMLWLWDSSTLIVGFGIVIARGGGDSAEY